MMSEKRFVQLGDTHIKDMVTGKEWYAPCEDGLLETLNNQQALINAFHEFIHLKGLVKEFDVFCNDVVVFKECGIDE